MLYREIIAVCPKIHTEHTIWHSAQCFALTQMVRR